MQRLAARLRRERTRGRLSSRSAALIALIVCGVLAVAGWPFVRFHLQAAAVLDRVGGQRVPRGLRWTVNAQIRVTEVSIPSAHGALRARLYTPVDHPDAPGLVLLHGVHHLGMNEPRLMAFAQAMAACGLRVLTPELPGIADYHVSSESTESIGEAAVWLAQQDPARRPVGVMGLSFSGGLSLLAAADPVFQRDIKFVVAVGSQGAMSRVADYYRTGEDARPTGGVERLPPHEYGELVLEYAHTEDFAATPADIAPLHALLRAHLYEDAVAEKAAFAALTPAQHAEAIQMLDTASPVTRARLVAYSAIHADAMAVISPEGHLRTLPTPVYLLHGAGDNIIPAAETLWMASELPQTSLRAMLISPVLSHLDLDGARPTAMDRWRLVHFFALVLRDAERK